MRFLLYLLMIGFLSTSSFAQTSTPKKTTTPVKKPATTAAKPATFTAKPGTTTAKKPATPVKKAQPVKTDKIFKTDNVTILKGKVIKITEDSIYYYPAATPKLRKRVAVEAVNKIVYANGTTKLIEPKPIPEKVVEEVKEEVVEKKEEPVAEPVVIIDEITLKSGAVITGRIVSQQKNKIGYRIGDNLDSGEQLFVASSKVWKLKYGATGQEVIINPVKEKTAKTKEPKPAKEPKEKKVREEVATTDGRVYRKFKVDVTLGYSRIMEDVVDASYGFNFSVEPKFNVLDNLAVGLKLEAAGFILSDDEDYVTLATLPSVSLTSEYYFGKKKVRPYIGVSAGAYFPKVYEFDDETITYSGDTQFGFAPRAGVQIGHFRVGAEYNIVEDGNFLSIKLGASIGGGKKKRK